jgi:glutamate N-acetyltransferase/amino-acid N-acetyltransferase
LLAPAVERSFNSISIDGDTSTNDTVLLLASGASGVKLNERSGEAFADALKVVCRSLAYQIVDDGEGVGHVVTLHVTGARTEAEAKQVAKAIAHSPLCKTAWSSGDPNWGRLLAAAGYSGVAFDPALMRITIGEQPVFELGVRAAGFDEAAAHAAMMEREYTITLDMGLGKAECRFLTCDLTEEYVRINADYST